MTGPAQGAHGERTIGIPPLEWSEPGDQRAAPTASAAVTVVDSRFADYSNWDDAAFDAQCFKTQASINQAWVGFWLADIGTSQVQRLQAAHIPVPLAYQWFAFDNADGPQRAMTWAIEAAQKLGITRMCADVESDSTTDPPKSIGQRISQLHAVYDLIAQAGMEPWYYGAPWAHNSLLGGTTEFAQRVQKVILANYGANDGKLAPIRNINFGGWTTCVAHQYWSLGNYCGRQARDLSYTWSDAFTGDEMTEAEIRAIIDDEHKKIWAAGAPPELRHYVDLMINPAPGGFTDANGNLLPGVEDAALVARVAALEGAPPPSSIPEHTHTPGQVAKD